MNAETKDKELENEMIPKERGKVKSNHQNIFLSVNSILQDFNFLFQNLFSRNVLEDFYQVGAFILLMMYEMLESVSLACT